jgi:hypothetical protein
MEFIKPFTPFILPIAVLIFGVVVLRLVIVRVSGFGTQAIRGVALVLVLTGGLFLVTLIASLQVPGEATAAGFGLLGTVAGYIFGKEDQAKEQTSDKKTSRGGTAGAHPESLEQAPSGGSSSSN